MVDGRDLKARFRGFMPVVIDVETSGCDPRQNAILEIGMVTIGMDSNGHFFKKTTDFEHILPFNGAVLDKASLDFNKIDPYQPLRYAVDEKEGLSRLFKILRAELKEVHCQRAVLVGHNAWFDLLFLKEAAARAKLSFPFHAFTCFDTATLSGVFYGQTVLAKAVAAAGLRFDATAAHSALYDAEITADLFCTILNTHAFGG
jgi:ribonuclease T